MIITGNIETKSEATDTISRNVALRNELDLYVNVLECKSYPELPARHQGVNIAVVRQNTEGEYAMLEHEVSIYVASFVQVWPINVSQSTINSIYSKPNVFFRVCQAS